MLLLGELEIGYNEYKILLRNKVPLILVLLHDFLCYSLRLTNAWLSKIWWTVIVMKPFTQTRTPHTSGLTAKSSLSEIVKRLKIYKFTGDI